MISRATIHLSTVVQSIDTRQKAEVDGKGFVKTMTGDFSFDEVVVTVPLGCLKMGRLRFIPGLPQDINRAVASASYSRLEKAFIAFPVPYWEQTHIDTFKSGKASPTIEKPYPMFTHFPRPTYATEEQNSWNLEMMALSSSAVFGAHAQSVLLFYLWVPFAIAVTSAISGLNPASDDYYSVIDTLFRPFYSRLPNYRQNHPDCVPTAVLTTNWQNDEFAGNGSYTNFTTHHCEPQPEGDIAVDDGVRVMRHGLPGRGLWFAGEHTAPLVALGTSTGAYWSGEAAATKILEAYATSREVQSDGT